MPTELKKIYGLGHAGFTILDRKQHPCDDLEHNNSITIQEWGIRSGNYDSNATVMPYTEITLPTAEIIV